jgi:hypothetical protein
VNQGANITLTLTNNGQPFPSFLQLHKDKSEYETNYFAEVSRSNTSITLTANNVTGSSDIEYTLLTGCNSSGLKRAKTVQVLPNCTGSLNGGPLYTFNTVSGGQNQVEMYLSVVDLGKNVWQRQLEHQQRRKEHELYNQLRMCNV